MSTVRQRFSGNINRIPTVYSPWLQYTPSIILCISKVFNILFFQLHECKSSNQSLTFQFQVQYNKRVKHQWLKQGAREYIIYWIHSIRKHYIVLLFTTVHCLYNYILWRDTETDACNRSFLMWSLIVAAINHQGANLLEVRRLFRHECFVFLSWSDQFHAVLYGPVC